MKKDPGSRTLRLSTLILLALIIGCAGSVQAAASEGEQIYVLAAPSAATGEASQPYAFGPMGTVAGARRLSVPEIGRNLIVLTEEGRVWTWGDNSSGQLGTGDLLARSTWVEVEGVDQVASVAAGALHSVAVKRDGTVWTWGANHVGQLGNGTLVSRPAPGAVPGLNSVKMVAAGLVFTLALRTDGSVWAFGSNWNEIAPNEAQRILMKPAQVNGLTGIEGIAVHGNRGYAKDDQGRFWVWGRSDQSQDSAVTEMSAQEAALLPARVLRQLGDDQAAALQTQWQTSLVRVGGSAIEVTKSGQDRSYAFAGTVIDVDWGWAVALIAGPATVANADASQSQLLASANGVGVGAGAASLVHANVTAAPPGTLTATETHGIVVSAGGACSAGRNEYGELGDGTTVDRWTPAPVTAETGLTGITKVATSWYHTLGLKSDGTAWSWGYNAYGALGDGTTVDKPTPIQVPGLTGIVGVAAGQYHSVAVKSDGTVWAWGYNGSGQLGNGTTTGTTSPLQTILLTGITAVAAGESHSLALKSDGTVWAWGYNGYGQLGDGTTTQRTSAVQVTGLTGVIAIAAGANHSMALKSDGTVWTWGYNGYGQLGDGSTTSRSGIVTVSGLTGVIGIAGGGYHSVAVKSDGTVWAWGLNTYGELGNATTTQQLTPVQAGAAVSNFTNLTAVAAGIYYSVALKSDGTRWAWGHNDYGQLGIGSTNDSVIPVQSLACNTTTLPHVTASPWTARLSASQTHSLALKSDGTVWAWGRNEDGELGNGTTIDQHTPVQASIPMSVSQVATGWYHSLALGTDRTVWAWGYNGEGQLGDGTTSARPTPVRAGTLSGVVGVSAGQYHSVAVRSDGTVWAWGYNTNGQLGNGSTNQSNSPVQAILISGVIAVAAGDYHTLALKSDGTVWAFGYNGYGQLGDGTTTQRTSAVQVLGLTGVIAIAAGYNHSLALRNDGTVWGWGYNGYGQLGDGGTASQSGIVRASGLTGIVAIATGDYHSLAVKNDGTVWAWGYNQYGQLGNASSTQQTAPVQAIGFTGGLAVAAGSYFSMALKSDGSVWCWGHNDYGQCGNGTINDSTIPVAGPPVSTYNFLPNAPPPVALQFVPVAPCRIADTRNPTGTFGGPSITGGSSRSFPVPSSTCGIPSTAAAYSINATVVPHGPLGFVTVFPSGQPLPLASTLNSLDGRVKANAAIVPAGTSGAISAYASDTTDVILDINGYFTATASSSTLTFFPLTPCRIADTRGVTAPLGGPSIAAGQDRTFPILSSACGVPATARAYSLNFTAVPHGSLGYISTFPTGSAIPGVSTLNAAGGQITANAAVVPAGTSGQIDVYAVSATDLIIDINGYFAPAGAGGLSLYSLPAPCRVLDTRNPAGSLPISGTQNTNVAGSVCTVPNLSNAQAYVFGATVVPPAALGFLTLWPQGQVQPTVSTLNALDGSITSNMAIVPVTNGFISSFVSDPTHLILDLSAYFAP